MPSTTSNHAAGRGGQHETQIGIRLPAALAAALRDAAEREHRTVSGQVRLAVTEHLERAGGGR